MVQACNQALESRRQTDALGYLANQPSLISETKKVNKCVLEKWPPRACTDTLLPFQFCLFVL